MKKLVVILLAMLALATVASAQLSYADPSFGAARTTQSTTLGYHDVLATARPAGGTAGRNGCQSCHVPHGAMIATTSTQDGYLWKYDISSLSVANDATTNPQGLGMALDSASFHTLACVGCHNGVTAADVALNFTWPSYAKMGVNGDLSHEHPVNAVLTQHGTTAPPMKYVRFYLPSGQTVSADPTTGNGFGYVECGSCHDPHKGDAATYDFLRGPAAGTTVADPKDATISYTGTSPDYARLGLCRQCHGK